MKKKVAPKKSSPKKARSSQSGVVTYQRIIIFTTCVVLALVGAVFMNKPAVTQSVAGISIANGLFAQTTVDLPEVDNAVAFNIYYKKAGDNAYTNAVRNIPVTMDSYTISYLTKGAEYDHKIAAVDSTGKEFWFSSTRPLGDLQPM